MRRRGRLLASRVADVLGRPVEFVDPATGVAESIEDELADPQPRPREPTPWATGLPVAAFIAVLVAIGDVVLSRAFADAFGLLWVPANLLVGLGLAPSLYLLRAGAVLALAGAGRGGRAAGRPGSCCCSACWPDPADPG